MDNKESNARKQELLKKLQETVKQYDEAAKKNQKIKQQHTVLKSYVENLMTSS
ncbi:hypothetical protein BB558_005118, partial [Smittium angustum]